ncbi:MAG: dienelactone hydrolase family protein [Anaerolineaceae bacterium]|nr:dienelactone hydrolase family protein [Anaerolineaceae bacterium]
MNAGNSQNPHGEQPVLTIGEPLESVRAAAILVHGRGANPESILSLVPEVGQPGFAYFAPQADRYTWYPHSFLRPVEMNEPRLSLALAAIDTVLAHIEAARIPAEKVILLGFSQGACIVLEYAARNPRRYGGVVGFSGGLIGATISPHPGSMANTPVFLGSGDPDDHVPASRVRESADVLAQMGAAVTTQLYPGIGHTIIQDEIAIAKAMFAALVE